MKLTRPQDAIHRSQIYRLLIEIADNPYLAQNLIFKGGTCAALLNRLDRFSVDLDFDLLPRSNKKTVKTHLEQVFAHQDLIIKDRSQKVLQYYLGYSVPARDRLTRQTLKFDAVNTAYKSDTFSPQFIPSIDRHLICQNIETMFAHKLVALTDRYHKHHSIAGRDLYDIRHFFLSNYSYSSEVIKERTKLSPHAYLTKLLSFIKQQVTQTIIDQDLNIILTPNQFNSIRKSLKVEVIELIRNELKP